jgi:NADH:ubiquinone oxidoreductase subunit H
MASMQRRVGPNKVGVWGLLQALNKSKKNTNLSHIAKII